VLVEALIPRETRRMPFQIPPHLLQRLRALRLEQRQLRASRTAPAPARPQRAGNFIGSVRRLFSGTSPVSQFAEQYVASMDAWQDEVEAKYDAFLLDPGMGPMMYLTSDGRILEDQRGWDGDDIVEVCGFHANSALIVGAKKTGIMELLELLPPPPPNSSVCSVCRGKRLAEPEHLAGSGDKFPCIACEARGWVDAAL
jgi:hypothetical protein